MRRFFLALALATTPIMSGCAPMLGGISDAPAPLQQSVIDEKGLLAAFSAFDVALTAVDGLVATGNITPGSPFALKLQGYLKSAQSGLNAAAAAQKAGSTTDYITAMQQVQKAMSLAGAALKKGS